MSRLDERKIIEIFQKKFLSKRFVSDDVEAFKLGENYGIVKVDTLVASTDVPPGMSPSEVARKSIVSPVSDFAAKGVRPLYCVISVSLPRSYSRQKILQLATGFKKASNEFGFEILGGDTNEADDLVISVVLFGLAKKIPTRGGARIGDYIVTTGYFGITSSGLKILLHGKKALFNFRKLATKSVLRPTPKLGFGIEASPYLSSSMDSSDGLSTTLNEMARQSGRRFVITHIPKDGRVDSFAKANKLDLKSLVFDGGEEYEIVATVNPRNFSKIKEIANEKRIKIIQIGHVQKGVGVFLKEGHKTIKIRDLGWSHFTK